MAAALLDDNGTNPEELLAAAHAGCFTMKLSFVLGEAGFIPDTLETTAYINFENGLITASHLTVKAKVSGISQDVFDASIKETELNCPVCQVLKAKITVESLLSFTNKETNETNFNQELKSKNLKYKYMEPQIGIKPENLSKVAHILDSFLADEFVLYVKTRNAHWNIEGSDFQEKHKLFEAQFQQLDEIIDKVAERIRSLGHYATSTLKSYLELTHLTEQSREKNDGVGYVRELLTDHESIIIRLRENINHLSNEMDDMGTGDFITGLMVTHEKIAWLLRAQLR